MHHNVFGMRNEVLGLTAVFALSGTLHLVRPQIFEQIVPSWAARTLGSKWSVAVLSGVAELACAVGMVVPQTRRAAGISSAALLIAVYPANIHMATQSLTSAQRHPGDRRHKARSVATLVRLPMQLPLIFAALRAGR